MGKKPLTMRNSDSIFEDFDYIVCAKCHEWRIKRGKAPGVLAIIDKRQRCDFCGGAVVGGAYRVT